MRQRRFTDIQIIDAYLDTRNHSKAAKQLGTHRNAVAERVNRMVAAGVKLPQTTGALGRSLDYTSQRVAELNEYVRSWHK